MLRRSVCVEALSLMSEVTVTGTGPGTPSRHPSALGPRRPLEGGSEGLCGAEEGSRHLRGSARAAPALSAAPASDRATGPRRGVGGAASAVREEGAFCRRRRAWERSSLFKLLKDAPGRRSSSLRYLNYKYG